MNPAVLDPIDHRLGDDATPPKNGTEETLESQALQIACVLERSRGLRIERRFHDAAGADHAICSCPVAGGRYLYDTSEPWGPRAIAFCRGDESAHMEALCTDYAGKCEEELEPVCRLLCMSDVRRRTQPDETTDRDGGS